MRRSEFKKRLKELGFGVIDSGYYIDITYEEEEIAWVHKYHESVMNSSPSGELNTEERAKLFDILVEYAKTPIREREDEKTYVIWPPFRKIYSESEARALCDHLGWDFDKVAIEDK